MKMNKLQLHKNQKLLFFGDSITDTRFNFRFNSSIGGKRIYALQVKKALKKHKIKVKIKGIASNRTYHLFDRVEKDCIKHKPDAIVMLIGVNDAWERYVPEEYPPSPRDSVEHFKLLFERFNKALPKTRVIYLLPFMIDSVEEKLPFHETLKEYREIFKSIALENNAIIIDTQELFNKAYDTYAPSQLAVDGIHPTDLGHSLMAKAVLEHIEIVNQ